MAEAMYGKRIMGTGMYGKGIRDGTIRRLDCFGKDGRIGG